MKDLEILTVRQVRIFRGDTVPLFGFVTREGRQTIQKAFHFSSMEPGDDGADVFVLKGGSFHPEGSGRPLVVNALHLNDRRVIVDVAGDSEAASLFFDNLWKVLSGPDEQSAATPTPVFFSQECTSAVTFDFDFSRLLNAGLTAYTNGPIQRRLSTDQVAAQIAAYAVGLTIRYSVLDTSITESSVTVSDKAVRLEPRVGFPLSERRFFAYTPTDSRLHAQILQEIEAAVVS